MNFALSILAGFAGMLVPALIFYWWVCRTQRRLSETTKPPQQEKLLRPPGYSLIDRLDKAQDAVIWAMLVACFCSSCAGLFVVLTWQVLAARASGIGIAVAIVSLVMFAVVGAVFLRRAWKLLNDARNLRLGLRGEQAVAEVLHEVADVGYRIFHDVQGGENWNIDHVAVGPRGVFVFETKARRKRPSRNGEEEHVVEYDGNALKFPAFTDWSAVSQAERNARWVAELLSKRTAQPVVAQPVIVIPGWYVKTLGNFPVKVMNAAYLAKYLRGETGKIEPAQVRRMIAVLDEKCRDLEF